MQQKCVIYCRVSTPKQAQEGESLPTQERICRTIARDKGFVVAGAYAEPFSGRKDHRPVYNEMMTYIKKHRGAVQYVLIRMIDRLTRAGSTSYDLMKRELGKYDVQLIDSMGIIQPQMNTLAHLGVEFDWSRYSPSELTEKMMADYGSTEVRHILTRLIGREIELVREGYKIGVPQDGYVNKKIVVDGKKRVIQAPDPVRAKFYTAMFELLKTGQYTDQEVVDRINAMGFQSRVQNVWNATHDAIVGRRGGRPLTVKVMRQSVTKPIYAGVIVHAWTKYQPVRARYSGIVDVSTFNAANRGKVFIEEHRDGTLRVLYNQRRERIARRYDRSNPLYLYKNIVRCPVCRRPFLGSAPKGKCGVRYPTYHCHRGHRYVGVPKETLETAVANIVRGSRFTPEFLATFEESLRTVWHEQRALVAEHGRTVAESVRSLERTKALLLDKLISTQSEVVKAELERRVEEVEQKIHQATDGGDEGRLLTRTDLDAFLARARHQMEHHDELLLGSQNSTEKEYLFSLFFEEWPTFADLQNGTPKLTLAFELSRRSHVEKVDVVHVLGSRWNSVVEDIKRWNTMDCLQDASGL